MAKYNGWTIEILNWGKFNPRKDVKEPSWFRMNHALFEDPKFYDLEPAHWAVFNYLCCEASKASSSSFVINYPHAQRVAKLTPKLIDQTIDILMKSRFLTVHVTAANVDVTSTNANVTDACSTYVRTDERDERNRTDGQNAATPAEPEIATPPASPSVISDESNQEILSKVPIRLQEAWVQSYDPAWIKLELAKARNWILANSHRAPKSNLGRFLNNWLSKGWEDYRKTLPGNPILREVKRPDLEVLDREMAEAKALEEAEEAKRRKAWGMPDAR